MPSRPRSVGLGFVGAGSIARERHLPAFRAMPGVELVAVATSSRERGQAAARELGFRRAHATWHEVVRDPEVDAVVVATWPDLHAAAGTAALEAGRHVLCEGRMAADLAGASAMLAAARFRPDLVAMVVPGAFSFWADAAIVRVIASGALGPLRGGRLTWSGGVYGVDPWRRLRSASGINTMALGIVYEALVRWLGRATWVSAATALHEPTMPGADGRPVAVDVPDHVVALVGYGDDSIVTIEMTADERPDGRLCWLDGSEGSLRVDFARRTLAIVPPAGRPERITLARSERRRWSIERDFVEAIHGRPSLAANDFEAAWHGMAFTDAVHRSAAAGNRVELPPSPDYTPGVVTARHRVGLADPQEGHAPT